MKKRILVILLILAAIGANYKFLGEKTPPLEAAAPPQSLRQLVDANCGACHAQEHQRPPGNYSLVSGLNARGENVDADPSNPRHGVVATARGILPIDMTNSDPTTALIVQKPLEGSITPHGGPKFDISAPVIQALMAWVSAGAPAGDMDRPAPIAVTYLSPAPGTDVIVYSRRTLRPAGFNRLRESSAGGNIYRLKFHQSGGNNVVDEDLNLTNLPGTDDAQNPSISLDGTKVAFARKQPGQPWQIWEVNSDGSGSLRQITIGSGNKLQPFYLPYKPTGDEARDGSGGVGFVSDAAGFLDEYDVGSSLSLYVCDANGGHLRQIDFNPSHDLHPWLHSSGMLIFTRWEHNEHQGHNSMSLFQISASDYDTAGTGLFGAFGEPGHYSSAGNSYHESSEVLDANFGKADDLFAPSYGQMLVRRSRRDDDSGSIGGLFVPRLQQLLNGTHVFENTIAVGDMAQAGKAEEMITSLSSVTYREPHSLLNGLYVTSFATLEGTAPQFNAFLGATEYVLVYSSFSLQTFSLSGSPAAMTGLTLLHEVPGFNVDEAIPLVVKPTPPKIGKPINLTAQRGVFTSGNVFDRNPNDGQPQLSASNASVVRFVRALQKAQGTVDTGRRRDDGIATQVLGEVPISSDGSFAADVPANVPMQFQVLDSNGRVVVNHKPWVHVAPGATERCVGCHARHDKPAVVQSLVARQSAPIAINTAKVQQFNFDRDIQPILNAKCVSCHDSARTTGAAGRTRGLSLVGRETPARTTESFQSLVGGRYVTTQGSRRSSLMWWITGQKLDDDPPTAYPVPASTVPHDQILTAAETSTIAKWIDTGTNFRVLEGDQVGRSLTALDPTVYTNTIWPIIAANCYTCHSSTGIGGNAMNLTIDDAESQQQLDEERIQQLSFRINFMIPEASILLRKPEPPEIGGLSHVGGTIWNRESAPYKAIFAWIASANPRAAPAPAITDLVNINNYPNPFRDQTSIVYGLTGAAATKVDIKIFSQNGKLIRELSGTTISGATIGWNRVVWDGKDKNGNTIGNDVYFYTIDADYGDGMKKRFRGKMVKVS